MLERSEAWLEEIAKPHPAGPVLGPVMRVSKHAKRGDAEEAIWLAFLTVLLGPLGGSQPYEAVARLYGGLGTGKLSWRLMSADRQLLNALFRQFPDQVAMLRFGNHRKYESREAIPEVVSSYIDAVDRHGRGSQLRWLASSAGRPDGRFSHLLVQVQDEEAIRPTRRL